MFYWHKVFLKNLLFEVSILSIFICAFILLISSNQINIYFGVGVILLFLLILYSSINRNIFFGRRFIKIMNSGSIADGEIKNIILLSQIRSRRGGNINYKFSVSFVFFVKNSEYFSDISISTSKKNLSLKVGDKIKIRYDPKDPKFAYPKNILSYVDVPE